MPWLPRCSHLALAPNLQPNLKTRDRRYETRRIADGPPQLQTNWTAAFGRRFSARGDDSLGQRRSCGWVIHVHRELFEVVVLLGLERGELHAGRAVGAGDLPAALRVVPVGTGLGVCTGPARSVSELH